MKNQLLCLIIGSVILISGCGQSEQEKKEIKNDDVKQKIMGEGKKPIPKFTDKNSLK
jgi:protein involved in sex pheromone biosynthesis